MNQAQDEIYLKAKELKSKGLKVMSLDYIISKYEENGCVDVLASRRLVEASGSSDR